MSKTAYVFFDIDGTLYDPRYGIPDSTQEAIDRLKKNGHHPVICTGRTKAMLLPEVETIGFDGFLGGAGAYGEWQDEVLFNDGLTASEAAELVRNFVSFGFHPYAEGVDYLYYDPETNSDPETEARRIFSLKKPEVLKAFEDGTEGIAKVSAVFTEKSDPENFVKTLNGRYHAVNHYQVLLETFRKDSSKGIAIRKLMDHLGEDLENTYAYGDSFNDLSMLETVKYGVCMENGDPKMLAQVPLHAPRLENDGIYLSLKEFGLI